MIRTWLPRALTVAIVVLVAGTFAPWLRSGARVRSSFEVAGALDRLQVLDGWVRPAVTVLWYFVPLLGALCVLATALDHGRAAAVGASVLAVSTISFALAVGRAGDATQWGVPVAVGASIAALTLSVATAVTEAGPRHRRGPRPLTIHHAQALERERER